MAACTDTALVAEQNHADSFFLDILHHAARAVVKNHDLAVIDIAHILDRRDTVADLKNRADLLCFGVKLEFLDPPFEDRNNILLGIAPAQKIVMADDQTGFELALTASVAPVVLKIAITDDKSAGKLIVFLQFERDRLVAKPLGKDLPDLRDLLIRRRSRGVAQYGCVGIYARTHASVASSPNDRSSSADLIKRSYNSRSFSGEWDWPEILDAAFKTSSAIASSFFERSRA